MGRGFDPHRAHHCDVSVHGKHPEPSGSGCFSLWLVLPRGVQGELAEDLSGGLGHDGDLAVLDDENDVGSGVGSADADVEELAVVAQRDLACGVDPVGAEPGRGRCQGPWGVLRCGDVGGVRGGLLR